MTALKAAATSVLAVLSLVSAGAAQVPARSAKGILVDPGVQSPPWEGWGITAATVIASDETSLSASLSTFPAAG